MMRVSVLYKTVYDCFFLSQETCVYAETTASTCFENLLTDSL